MTRLLPVAAAVVVLLFSGLVHGVWTDRWAELEDLHAAVARLDRLPLNLGEWQGEEVPMKNRQSSGLAGCLARRYVHRPTGKAVTIFLGCGRPGPVSIHTPDVCYAASGFEVEAKKEVALPADSACPGAAFYTSMLRHTRGGDRTQMRIFWSWHADGKWEVAENPRFTFARQQILYKLYVIREATGLNAGLGRGGELSADPCVELMNQLLPAFRRQVLAAS
ncbi:MAG: exosortase-associated EpsI family protein [Gemmataceae bacterium]|nr:exosortase-associated EpsI family protein [Gemmataceae bacterium]